MKTAIIYASLHGTTKSIAQKIFNNQNPEETEIFSIKETGKLDLSRYERIILGSSIHAGKNQRSMQDFCKKNMTELSQKRIGLFLCCLNAKEFEQSTRYAYPEILRKKAFAYGLMGGEYLFAKMNFIEKFLVKKIVGVSKTESHLNEDAIEKFMKEIDMDSQN